MHVLELFPCSGGMAEGLRRAGIPIAMAFDYDADAVQSYAANMGQAPVTMDVRDLLRMARAGWRGPAIDLLVADPPCTPWSRAGKRLGTADERDTLEITVELVELLRPRTYLIANIPGLDDGPNWPVVQRTIGGLARAGYCANDFVRLDAADFGVPQHRVRPFWYGHLDGPCISWPTRTHGSPEECAVAVLPGVSPLLPWVTCRQALSHLSAEELGSPVRLRWRGANGKPDASIPDRPARVVGTSALSDGNVLAHSDDAIRPGRRQTRAPGRKPRASHVDEPADVVTTRSNGGGNVLYDGPNHRPSTTDAPARTLTRNTHGDGALLLNDKHPVNTIDAPSMTVTSKGDGRGAQGACVLAWPWDRPSTTVTGDSEGRLAPPGHHGKSFLSDNRGHGPNAMKLSEKAAAILQGFPPGWRFVGATKKARWAQIGMAMPPPLAEAVGRAILRRMPAESLDRVIVSV
jgi:site-specific DNA-cytosine methylase